MLEPGFRRWLPGMLWHYKLHQMKLFKDFAPKKSSNQGHLHLSCYMLHFTYHMLPVDSPPEVEGEGERQEERQQQHRQQVQVVVLQVTCQDCYTYYFKTTGIITYKT